ncbi:uncharacterized protein C16orf52 homolog [Mizuhopecten yessoensis]|uniref:Claudin n=1 Tax=Mizuhopecten yessoensis TaxID=6573 RepID=A0A210R6U1_MIZYE|nr:uncharacterized protein C16orf52 homolog [Mizuhopecten yessoensis]OWF56760.1 hypothetical protein KP79_PYT00023 [Mizuhopecten yessoensis]
MGFSDSSSLLKTALAVFPLALILHIVGLATPSWATNSGSSGGISFRVTAGLWKQCNTVHGETECIIYPQPEDWQKACQAFGIIGVLAVSAAAILEGLCTVLLTKSKHKIFFIATTLLAFLGAGSIILTAIIWAAKIFELQLTDLVLSWSFGLSIAGAVLSGVGGILMAIDLCQNSNIYS